MASPWQVAASWRDRANKQTRRFGDLVQQMESREQALLVQREQRAWRTSILRRAVIVLGIGLAILFVAVALHFLNKDFAGARKMNAALEEAKSNLVRRILGFSRPQEQKKQVAQLQPVIEER